MDVEFLGQQITVALLVSLVVQGVISIFVFAAGIRVAKERSDRSTVRAIYKDILEHLKELLRRTKSADPMRWPDFKLEREGYMPLMRKLEKSGDLNLLPPTLGADLVKVEFEALQAGQKFRRYAEEELAPKLDEFIRSKVDTSKPVPSSDASKGYISFTPFSALIADERYIASTTDRLATTTPRLGFGMRLPGGKVETVMIIPERLVEGDLPSFYRALTEETKKIGADAAAELAKTGEELEWAIQVVSERIRDPHPFSETVLGIIPAMFHQSSGRKRI